jgi:hypothetical protein
MLLGLHPQQKGFKIYSAAGFIFIFFINIVFKQYLVFRVLQGLGFTALQGLGFRV